MKQKIFNTADGWTGLISRVTLGALILPHGLQKTFGLFGGYGFSGTMGWFTETMHLPWILSAFVIVAEFLGAISLLIGLAARFWALVMVAIMIGAVLTVHLPYGWFMDWNGVLKGEGYEYHVAIIALAIIVLLDGAGKYSLDLKRIPS